MEYPIVPLRRGRVKISLHAANTEDQIVRLVCAIFGWVEEIHALEEEEEEECQGVVSGSSVRVTSAARRVYDWMRSEGLDGFGMV